MANEIMVIALCAIALIGTVVSLVVLYFTNRWKDSVSRALNLVRNEVSKINERVEADIDACNKRLDVLQSEMGGLQEDTRTLYSFAHMHREAQHSHDQRIHVLERDLQDLRVRTGIIPDPEETERIRTDGAVNERIDNLLGEVRALQEDRKETMTIISSVNDRLGALSDAYNGIHAQEEKLKELDANVVGLTDIIKNVVERVEHLEEYS